MPQIITAHGADHVHTVDDTQEILSWGLVQVHSIMFASIYEERHQLLTANPEWLPVRGRVLKFLLRAFIRQCRSLLEPHGVIFAIRDDSPKYDCGGRCFSSWLAIKKRRLAADDTEEMVKWKNSTMVLLNDAHNNYTTPVMPVRASGCLFWDLKRLDAAGLWEIP